MTTLILFGQHLLAQSHDPFLNETDTYLDNNVSLIGRWSYGPFGACIVSGNYAYIGNGEGLEILDISSQNFPTRIGRVIIQGVIKDIYVTGNYVCVANGEDGLLIIDVSDPISPNEVSFFDRGDIASGVYVSGNYAFVADEGDGL